VCESHANAEGGRMRRIATRKTDSAKDRKRAGILREARDE